MMRRVLVLVLVICGCSAPSPRTSSIRSDDVPDRFEDRTGAATRDIFELDPAEAVSLGHHEYDGRLPDVTPAAIAAHIRLLQRDRDALLAYPLATLTPAQQLEREALLGDLRNRLFKLVDLDTYRTNPMSYSDAINLDAYILRDYAPAATRAAGVVRLCSALPGYLAQARTNLAPPIPRPWIDTALLQTRGYLEFADKDVRAALSTMSIDAALDTCKHALTDHAAWLVAQQPTGTQAFALGTEKFLKMLADSQGVAIDLPRLTAIAEADLARNLAALQAATHAIDPAHSTREVVEAMATDRPTAATVIAVATEQAAAMRQFLIDHQIVSIPSEEVAEVRESPPFQRWNSAFLDAPGPFETKKLPSFYYISPPDPAWPKAEQLAYLPPKADLMFTTIHEVWPGHFLQRLHRSLNPSRVLQQFCAYSNAEGWAHYAEEMMFDAGAGGQTPQARIGMLKEALLRNVRFVATIGLHTGGMSIEQATKLFADKGFVDAGNARQQAVRGTFDPMYLSYTLGKLMIRKLRTDWLAANPGKSLREFHDTLLSYGCGPLPSVRRAMLGPAAGPAL